MVPLAKFDISLKNTPPVWCHFVQKVGRGMYLTGLTGCIEKIAFIIRTGGGGVRTTGKLKEGGKKFCLEIRGRGKKCCLENPTEGVYAPMEVPGRVCNSKKIPQGYGNCYNIDSPTPS